jgi:hypothetical protein
VCTATYSDGTSKTVTPSWSENSAFTTISSSGLLRAGDVEADQNVILTAVFEGKTDTHAVVVAFVAPRVELTRLVISGPDTIEEGTAAQYVCTAHYSDGSSAEVTPVWSENSALASINGSGLLTARNTATDESVTVTASFEDQTDSHDLVIMAIGDQAAFPLSGFEGKTVSARLWDHEVGEWVELGEAYEPSEIVVENVNPDQWYWLGLSEVDDSTGELTLVHGNWFRM